jgi:uncharacterized protein YndB with AHSA1/START domain
MFKFSVRGRIARPVDEVFAYLADVTKQSEWEPNIVSCHLNDDAPIRVGATATQRIRVKGKEREVQLTVAEYEPGKRIRFEKQKPVYISFGWTLEPEEGGTKVDYPVELAFRGTVRVILGLMRLLVPFGFKTPVHKDLARIKANLERRG